MLSVNSGLIYIDGEGMLHYNGKIIEIADIDTSINHSLVLYGNNVVIFPDKKFFNLSTEEFTDIDVTKENFYGDYGSEYTTGNFINDLKYGDVYDFVVTEHSIQKVDLNSSGVPRKVNCVTQVYIDYSDTSVQKVQSDGSYKYKNIFSGIEVGETVEDSHSVPSVLYRCTSEENTTEDYIDKKIKSFIPIESYYLKITAEDGEVGSYFNSGFKTGDFVKISGLKTGASPLVITDYKSNEDYKDSITVLNDNYFKIYGLGKNYIVIKANIDSSVPYNDEIKVSRLMPDIDTDKVIEVNNRLWACSSKNNEIYSCKQGDCTNWQAYSDGISTDSFAMTVGCEGEFTGIARQNDSVIFFKENWVLKIYGTKPSNYTLATYNVLGVEKGSSKSVVWINGILYYLSKKGVCQYSPGSQPIVISEYAFGNVKYKNGVAGRHNNKYYISVENEDGEYELFVYDTDTNLWHKEDNTKMLSTVTYNNTMYYIDGVTGYIMCPDDKHNLMDNDTNFEREGVFDWSCETGDLYDSEFNTKYISRISVGVKSDKGTQFKISAQFEDGGEWKELKIVRYDRKRPQLIPVAVRRSDYLRIRIEGIGQCEIYGINIEYAQGSDVR